VQVKPLHEWLGFSKSTEFCSKNRWCDRNDSLLSTQTAVCLFCLYVCYFGPVVQKVTHETCTEDRHVERQAAWQAACVFLLFLTLFLAQDKCGTVHSNRVSRSHEAVRRLNEINTAKLAKKNILRRLRKIFVNYFRFSMRDVIRSRRHATRDVTGCNKDAAASLYKFLQTSQNFCNIFISAKWTEWNWRILCFHFCVCVCARTQSHWFEWAKCWQMYSTRAWKVENISVRTIHRWKRRFIGFLMT